MYLLWSSYGFTMKNKEIRFLFPADLRRLVFADPLSVNRRLLRGGFDHRQLAG
jgi:hypothetical protein